TRSLSELDADLVVLHETAQKFDKSLRDIHSEYVSLMQELNLEATELKRAA
ncbi:hypothetical protein GOV10_05280, partial [Candidatus Woesearchaeota archaeon]|nr:hypothetical protein [Candidatus Woesearchaeota archaeon]